MPTTIADLVQGLQSVETAVKGYSEALEYIRLHGGSGVGTLNLRPEISDAVSLRVPVCPRPPACTDRELRDHLDYLIWYLSAISIAMNALVDA